MIFDRVLVTGGSGFVGTRLKRMKPEWIYVSSEDYELTNVEACNNMFLDIRPRAVIHLAGLVGGIKRNTLNQAEFFYKNIMINTNVIHCAYKNGVSRVLSSLATCAYPADRQKYPFVERDILDGMPEKTNLAFAYAKRCLYIQSNSYREQHNMNYACFTPCNLYGPEDNFSDNDSHFVAAMIKKIAFSKNGDKVEFWGTGKPLRQELYVDDLVKIIPILLEKHNSESPIIVAPHENLSIKQMIQMCIEISGKQIKPVYNGNLDGQYRKDGSNKELLETIDDFKFTTFREGLNKTYEWYEKQ
jgi:GDP-L-fucose synthase